MGLYKRKDSPIWWMSFCYNHRQYQRSTGTADRRLAEAILAKVKTQIVEGKWFEIDQAKQHTFDEMMERFLREHAPRQQASTQKRYNSAINHLRNYFEGMTLSEITTSVISNYMQQRLQNGAAPATVNREFRVLSRAFNLAWKQWEWVRENPCLKVSALKENNTIIRYLSQDEENRLLQAATGYLNGQLPDIITLAIHTGMRQSEILNLSWKNIDLFRKVITLEKTKNKEPRTIPLNRNALSVLVARQRTTSIVNINSYVFTTDTGNRILRRNLMREFYKVTRKAGIENFRFHDLRHTTATRLVQAGVDLYTVAKLLGHKDMKSTQRYAHHNPESLRQHIEKISIFSDPRKTEKEASSG